MIQSVKVTSPTKLQLANSIATFLGLDEVHASSGSSIELGKSLLFVGAQWQLMDVQLHFNSPAWNQLRAMRSSV